MKVDHGTLEVRGPPYGGRMDHKPRQKSLTMEKIIYQHRGSMLKYETLWGPWVDVPGLALGDLTMDRLLGINAG